MTDHNNQSRDVWSFEKVIFHHSKGGRRTNQWRMNIGRHNMPLFSAFFYSHRTLCFSNVFQMFWVEKSFPYASMCVFISQVMRCFSNIDLNRAIVYKQASKCSNISTNCLVYDLILIFFIQIFFHQIFFHQIS